jgi:hypothetical protein
MLDTGVDAAAHFHATRRPALTKTSITKKRPAGSAHARRTALKAR